ncbi:6-hydroxymethyl-7,8-dihydropterin pyrophosphokinase [uncultured archaeon]|nr:6-hydroxymethyl-7,8-dihydropterin pyrophosphokinase [uncultured archaeon]
MKFEEWEPIYNLILEDMHFDRLYDERSARLLSKMLEMKARKKIPDVVEVEVVRKAIQGKDVLVCGKAPRLKDDIKNIDVKKYVVITADGATSVLLNAGITPDIIVTDLDGNMDDEARANEKGAIMVVHAHGDNMDALSAEVPRLKRVIGTTQSKPLKNVYNFGGFSDGDRSVFLALEMGAKSITLIGFDFKDVNVTPLKKKKLMWAEKLIDMVMGEEA